LGFWKTLGKVASIAAPIIAAPFTGGTTLALLGAGAGAANRALSSGSLQDIMLGAGLGSIPGVVKGTGALSRLGGIGGATTQEGAEMAEKAGWASKVPWAQVVPTIGSLAATAMGSRAQGNINERSLQQQLEQFRAQQAFVERQAAADAERWAAQQAEDERRYNEMTTLQKEQWGAQQAQEQERYAAQQRLRAPYREASAQLLGGAFGSGAIRPYPGATLWTLAQRG